MSTYSDFQFKNQVSKALYQIQTILDVTRNPVLPSELSHTYTDKYNLAQQLTNTTIAAQLNVLESLGLTTEQLRNLYNWSQTRTVTLKFDAEEKCKLNRKADRKVESSTTHVREVSGFTGGTKTITDKVITTVTEWFWDFSVSWKLYVYKGNDPNTAIVLQKRTGSTQIITSTEHPPKSEYSFASQVQVQITWLLQNLTAQLQCKFIIDREKKSCRTPRRNEEIGEILINMSELDGFARDVNHYLEYIVFPNQENHALDLNTLNSEKIFNPIQPLFENLPNASAPAETQSQSLVSLSSELSVWPAAPVLQINDVNLFLKQQKSTLTNKLVQVAKIFPASESKESKLISYSECALIVNLCHLRDLGKNYIDAVNFIEEMLRSQLISAIGKTLSPADFHQYMRYHNRKIFKPEYLPQPFCYAIRRPEHYPEGVISIDATMHTTSSCDPILTSVRKVTPIVPMSFALNAATKITFNGHRYLHAWLNHSFEGDSGLSLSLNTRARQFSSFIVVLGRIQSATELDPKHAFILQNKDDLSIPLLLEQLPTPKAFQDAIESLSPEQQRFAKAYRSMQLESSLCGIVVIQLKPQLEKLLYLPNDSLTKQIQLTENLLELFIKYQIPSDQLSYDELTHPGADANEKIRIVESHVRSMYAMIESSKKKELKEKTEEANYNILDSIQKSLAPSFGTARPKTRFHGAPGGVSRGGSGGGIVAMPMKLAFARPAVTNCSVSDSPAYNPPSLPPPSVRRSPMSTSAQIPQPVSIPPPVQLQQAPSQVPQMDSNSSVIPSEPVQEQPMEQATQQQQPEQKSTELTNNTGTASDIPATAYDFTKLPTTLDAEYLKFDEDASLRSTIINYGSTWSKKSQESLLSDPVTKTLGEKQQVEEKKKAFDLLDAITKSGCLPIDAAELHVLVASTHAFDASLINTVIQENVNPIERLERSALIINATIQNQPAVNLLKVDQVQRIKEFSAPKLLPGVNQDAIMNQ